MPYVDEKLLARLVDKYGLERQTTNLARSGLWGKVTKEYNQVRNNEITFEKLKVKHFRLGFYRRKTAIHTLGAMDTWVLLNGVRCVTDYYSITSPYGLRNTYSLFA